MKKSTQQSKNILYTSKVRKFQGTYIAVTHDRVIASGKDAKEAYQSAKRILGPRKKIEGLYYVPQKKDILTAY